MTAHETYDMTAPVLLVGVCAVLHQQVDGGVRLLRVPILGPVGAGQHLARLLRVILLPSVSNILLGDLVLADLEPGGEV